MIGHEGHPEVEGTAGQIQDISKLTLVQELNDVENKHLHDWEKYNDRYDVDYPEPCLDYKQARKDVMNLYKKSLS